MIAALLLLLGVLAIAAIMLVAAKCRCKTAIQRDSQEKQEEVDPWTEAGKRHQEEYP
jgi:hypothetical protein